MSSDFTHLNLATVEDIAPARGFGERWEARGAREALHAEQTGVMYFRLHPGKRSPFVHRHRDAEEIYVIVRGSGKVKVGDEVRHVRALDAIRVAPSTPRAFEAGADGLDYVAVGAHHAGDGELVDDDWGA